MPIWPTMLPTNPATGWTETPGNPTIRTETDSGPAKLRRRFTSAPSKLTLVLTLYPDGTYTGLQKANRLIQFYENGSAGSPPGTAFGSLSITGFPHPRDGSTVTLRFVDPPVVTQLSADVYRASLSLEKL